MELLFVGPFFGIILLIIIISWSRKVKEVSDLPTLDEYIRRHPACKKRGAVSCFKCDSTGIYIHWLYGPGVGPKKHLCRTCGTDLWKSD